MKLGVRIYYFENGEMELWLNTEKVYSKMDIIKPISKWYNRNPYAKRLNKEWICQDYRIDQQRPQRNVYSQAYLKASDMTDLEEKFFTSLVDGFESKIEYPTVWDNGKEEFYEETIYCPNCHKRRKVLTSHEHCEFCGFEFKNAVKCKKCGTLNLKENMSCNNCGFILNDIIEKKYNGRRKVVGKKQCVFCNMLVDEKDKYCCNCGKKFMEVVECNNCGEINNKKNRFCVKCGELLL